MAVVNFVGFEIGSSAPTSFGGQSQTFAPEAYIVAGASLSSTVKRSGSYSLRANPSGTGTSYAVITSPAAPYVSFWVYVATAPTAQEPIFGSSGSVHIRLNSDRTVSLYDGTTARVNGTTVIPLNTWTRIAAKSSSSGYELVVGTTSQGSGSTSSSLFGSVNVGKGSNLNGSGYDVYFDDIVCDDSTMPSADYKVALLPVTGDGAYTAWLFDYTYVDDFPGALDGSYVYSQTNTARESVTLADIGTYTSYVAVKAGLIIKEASSSTIAFAPFIRVGTTDYDFWAAADSGSGTTWNEESKVYTTSPATSSAWTQSEINSLEVGVRHSQSQARQLQVDAFYATVLYEEASVSNQTATASGIASTAALGTPAAANPVAQTSTATGIASTAAFGTPTTARGAITSTASGIASTAAYGTPSASRGAVTSTASGIASTTSFGTPSTTNTSGAQTATATGIASTVAYGSPAAAVGGVASESLAIGYSPSTQFQSASSEYLSCPSTAFQMGSSPFAVSGWVYLDTTSVAHDICGVYSTTGSQRSWRLYVDTNNRVTFVGSSDGATNTADSPGTTLAAGAWYHIYAEWNGTQLGVSINGASLVQVSFAGPFFGSTARFTVGSTGNAAAFLNGRLQHVSVWRGRVLTSGERSSLYNSGNPNPIHLWEASDSLRTNLLSYWTGDPDGGWWRDVAGGGNHLYAGGALISPYVENGGFEDAGAGGADVFANWTESTAGTSAISRDTSVFDRGGAAARLDCDSSGSSVFLQRSSILTVGATYAVRMRVRATGGTWYVCGNTSDTITPGTSWTTITRCFVASSTNFILVTRSSAASQSLWVDEVSLWPVTPIISPTTLNGGFETAGSGGADVFANWSELVAGTSTVNRDTVDFNTGVASLRFDVDASASVAQVGQSGLLVLGVQYFYRVAAKCNSTAASLAIGADSSGSGIKTHSLTTSWANYVSSFIADNASFVLKRSGSASKSIYADSVYLMTVGFWSADGAQTGAFGAASSVPGAVSSSASGIAPATTLGAPAAVIGALVSTASGISSTAYGTPTASVSAVTGTASGVAPPTVFGTPTGVVGAATATVSGIAPTTALGTPSASASGAPQTSTATGIASTASYGTPAATKSQTSVASGIASTTLYGTPSTSLGAVTATASGVSSTASLGTPAATKSQASTSVGIASTTSLGTPAATLTGQAQTSTASGIAPTTALGTPSASPAPFVPDGLSSPDGWALTGGGTKFAAMWDRSDSTYISSSATSGTTQRFSLSSPGLPSGSTVDSVQVYVRHMRGGTQNGAITPSLVLAGTVLDGTSIATTATVTDSVQTIGRPGGGSWSLSDLEDLEVQVRNTTTRDNRVYEIWCSVAWTAPVASNQDATASGIASTVLYGTPSASTSSNQDATASGIAPASVLGTPSVSVGVLSSVASGVVPTTSFGNPSTSVGPVASVASGIASTAVFGTPAAVKGGRISTAVGISSTSSLGTPASTLAQTSAASGVAPTATFGTPAASTGGTVVSTAVGIASTASFGAPSASRGGIASSASGIAPTSSAGTPRASLDQSSVASGVAPTTVSGLPHASLYDPEGIPGPLLYHYYNHLQ